MLLNEAFAMRKITVLLAIVFLGAIIAFLFSSSSQKSFHVQVKKNTDQTTVFFGEAMTMNYRIIIGKELSLEQREEVQKSVSDVFEGINSIHNKWNPYSELSKLNNLKAQVKCKLSPQLKLLLQKTQLVVELSEGRFDPTIESLQQLWKNKLDQKLVPTDAELAEIKPSIGWDKIHFDEGIFYKDHDLVRLDLGGIAKGFAIDTLFDQLKSLGDGNLFVEWGGEIRAGGRHPENRPWKIYISRLGDEHPEHAIDTLSLVDQSIATSGDYLQNWSIRSLGENGKEMTKTYFHIFDSQTLHPLETSDRSIASVSVIACDCTFADGLATAAMMFADCNSAEIWAEQLKNKYPELSFWIVSRN